MNQATAHVIIVGSPLIYLRNVTTCVLFRDFIVILTSGVLTGGNHAGRVKDPFTDFSGPQNIGHLFFVLKPNLFVGNSFNKRIKDNIKTIKKLPKIKGVKEILYPGQSKFNRFKSNLKKEINISKAVLKDLEYLQSI
mgnify:CR=1 FL=1